MDIVERYSGNVELGSNQSLTVSTPGLVVQAVNFDPAKQKGKIAFHSKKEDGSHTDRVYTVL